jgi:long-chain acyl-CoA synthetase
MVAVVVLNPDVWKKFAAEIGVRHDMPESLKDTRVEQQVLLRIGAQLKEFPGYARVHRVLIQTEPWTVENGIMTPTLKMRRNRVTKHFEKEIEQLYKGHWK